MSKYLKILILSLIFFSNSAYGKYELLIKGKNVKIYVDSDKMTATKNPKRIKIPMLLDFTKADKFGSLSRKAMVHVDCENKEYKLSDGLGFNKNMGEGKIVVKDTKSMKWTKIPSASSNLFEFISKNFCR